LRGNADGILRRRQGVATGPKTGQGTISDFRLSQEPTVVAPMLRQVCIMIQRAEEILEHRSGKVPRPPGRGTNRRHYGKTVAVLLKGDRRAKCWAPRGDCRQVWRTVPLATPTGRISFRRRLTVPEHSLRDVVPAYPRVAKCLTIWSAMVRAAH